MREALLHEARGANALEESTLRRRATCYAAGKAGLLRQIAARKLVDRAIANTAADARVGARVLYDALIREVIRTVPYEKDPLGGRVRRRRRALQLQFVEVAVDLLASSQQ